MKLSHQANRKDFVLCNRPFCQNGADRASTENWGYKLYSSMAAQAAVMRAEVNNVQRKIASCAEKRLKNKKGRAKGDKCFLEIYLHDIKILMDDETIHIWLRTPASDKGTVLLIILYILMRLIAIVRKDSSSIVRALGLPSRTSLELVVVLLHLQKVIFLTLADKQ